MISLHDPNDPLGSGHALTPIPEKPDSANHFGVVAKDGKIVICRPMPDTLTNEQALNLAAWLCVMADADGKNFTRLMMEIASK